MFSYNRNYYSIQEAPEGGYLVTTHDGTFDNRFATKEAAEEFCAADQAEYDNVS